MKNVSIFASGGGSNARCIIEHLQNIDGMSVGLVVTNKKDAGVIDIARQHNIPVELITNKQLADREYVLPILSEHSIDFIALAGFLMLIPGYLVKHYEGRMTNIHPALLPKYGGKGMYGLHVHEAVHAAGDSISGMTIHYVTQEYDKGGIILQASTTIDPNHDTPASIAAKVLALEHRYYPIVVEELLSSV